MRRSGLKRFVALATLVSMMACEFTVYGEPDTEDTAQQVESEDSSKTDKTTGSADSSGVTEVYTNEMLERNYTQVSKKYTYPKYTGEKIVIKSSDAYVSGGLLTDEIEGYTGDTKVIQVKYGETVTVKINAPKNGVYVVGFDYIAYNEIKENEKGEEEEVQSILVPEAELTVNGEVPFYECNRQIYESLWVDPEEKSYDRYDNEIVSIPSKAKIWSYKAISDASYRYSTPLALQLEKGENTITIKMNESNLKIGNFYLSEEETIDKYESGNTATGDFFVELEAERPAFRNDSSIRPTCEYDVDLKPYNSSKKTLNIIDSASFADAGQTVQYEVDIEESGYYYIATNYRQSDKVDFPVFMDIKVKYPDAEDFVIPNELLQAYEFDYTNSFKLHTLQDNDDKKMAVYLKKGKNTISFTISHLPLREAFETIDVIMNEINDLALNVTKLAGTNTSKYREIDILSYIPDVEEKLQRWIDDLNNMYAELSAYSDAKSVGALSSIKTAVKKLESFKEDPNEIPYRIKELATSTSSVNQMLANLITSLDADNISFDRIFVYQEDSESKLPNKSNIFTKIWESIVRFFKSFDDQAYSVDNTDATHLQVWINRPRQYLEIIQQLIDKTFTPETGIEVDLCIMPDAQKLILSNAAGNAPDVGQAVDYAQPIEFALRDAIVDLTEFDYFEGDEEYLNYQNVLSQFSPGILIPSTMNDGIYSVPETFYFWVLFYRTDVLEKLGIEVPDTMEDVKEMIPKLNNRGLNFYYPTAGTVGTRTFAMTTPLFYQYGATLYGATAGDTTINSEAGVAAFKELTELFTIYDIPQEANFYQHFRNGDYPIGISDYFTYSLLINAAPEIENSWKIALVPGVEDEDGVVQRQTAGAAQNSIIFKSEDTDPEIILTDSENSKAGDTMKREEAAWRYLEWWMSTETQVEFGTILQTTYGKEYIWNSANIEAFSQLPWKSRDREVILEQMQWITESPRIPGTYMLERELSNAYISVVVQGEPLRTTLDSAVKLMNRETERKLKEFKYLDNSGNVIKEYKVPTIDTVKAILGIDD